MNPADRLDQPSAALTIVEQKLDSWRTRTSRRTHDLLIEVAEHFDPDVVVAGLVDGLERRLSDWLGRAVAVDLHRAREAGALRGSSPEARYRDFVESWSQPGARSAFFERYPVLRDAVDSELERAGAVADRLVGHLAADATALIEHFALDASLIALDLDRGDRHDGGHTVARLGFGDGRGVFYKPRSLAPEQWFYRRVERLGAAGLTPPPVAPAMLARGEPVSGERGYMLEVEPAPCVDRGAADRYFERLGALLAVARSVGATDLHHGNLVAVGEVPVLVDLETLFHPRLLTGDGDVDRDGLLSTGLFPPVVGHGGDADGALAIGDGAAVRVLRRLDSGTDAERWAWCEEVPPPPAHAARDLDGRLLVPGEHAEAIEAGFRRAWTRIGEQAQDWLSETEGLVVRVVPRPTRIYARLLRAAWHPSQLVGADVRRALFDRLAVDVPNRPFLAALLEAERRALERADIPRFHVAVDGVTVRGEGEELPDFLAESGLDAARRRLDAWDDAALDREVWLLRRALWSPDRVVPWAEPTAVPRSSGSRSAIDAAFAAGRALGHLAMGEATAGHAVDWLELGQIGPTTWAWRSVGPSLYGGSAGLALAYAQLAGATAGSSVESSSFESLAKAAIHHLEWRVGSPDAPPADLFSDVGAFTGWGGPIYAQLVLARWWNEPERLRWATRLAAAIAGQPKDDAAADLVSGLAGWVLVLLRLHRAGGGDALFSPLEAAISAGERLLDLRLDSGSDRGAWPSTEPDRRPLVGLAHGVSGPAWACAELAAETGDARFERAALDGAAWERRRRLDGAGEWPDLRPAGSDTARPPMTAWCHGSPGLVVARRAMLDALGEDGRERESLVADLEMALDSLMARGFDDDLSHSLCHGRLGHLMIAARALAESDPRRARIAALSASCIETLVGAAGHDDGRGGGGFRPGAPPGLDPPGLMTGRAGLIHALLWLAAPRQGVSILHLEIPNDRFTAPPGRGQGDFEPPRSWRTIR